jgi:hypothetical protein
VTTDYLKGAKPGIPEMDRSCAACWVSKGKTFSLKKKRKKKKRKKKRKKGDLYTAYTALPGSSRR